ncbi:GTP-binding protein [Tumidithrix helvetica PCC 7403]|uniref:YcjF family protein n=1 Tax=Tumidithrix helvetica TaxID=3457545 RepID=UPI003C7F4AD4
MARFPWLRSLLLFIGIGLIVSFAVALLDRILQIYNLIATASPILAGLCVLLLIALLFGLFIAIWRYLRIFGTEPEKKRPEPEVSTDKVEAAEESIAALQQQLEQIQDEITKRSLLERSEDLRDSFTRLELKVVVFGVGSAGKTSLVNALLAEAQAVDKAVDKNSAEAIPKGEVGAVMGTTTIGETYAPVRFKNLEFPVIITDCPGILEAGAIGSDREQEARLLATEADLLLFVVDDDLRQSEYEALKALTAIGKRTLLVFNKVDRFTKSDRESILAQLRQRVVSFIAPGDVVAIAARPATLTLDSGEIVTPSPKLKPLLTQLVDILNYEADELIADNVLLQSQRLGAEARRIINTQRQAEAEKVVEKFQWLVAGVVFATPLPVVDLLATAAINAQMVVELGKVYGADINLERGKELASSLTRTLVSLGIVKGVVQIVSTAISLTIVGLLLKATVQGVTAAYLTRIAGKSFIEYFSRNQDWGDGGIAEVVQRQFQLNRRDEFIKSFIQEAVNRVMQLSKIDKSK